MEKSETSRRAHGVNIGYRHRWSSWMLQRVLWKERSLLMRDLLRVYLARRSLLLLFPLQRDSFIALLKNKEGRADKSIAKQRTSSSQNTFWQMPDDFFLKKHNADKNKTKTTRVSSFTIYIFNYKIWLHSLTFKNKFYEFLRTFG